VEVTGVTITAGPDDDGLFTGTTNIDIYFDKSMIGGDVSDDPLSYFVEVVPGLVENQDPNMGAEIVGLDYDDTTDEYHVSLTVNGVIASTDEADLPRVKIVEEIKGGNPLAPVAADFRDVFYSPDDMVGPYLKKATFSLNPQQGDASADLLENEEATLTVEFSEDVYRVDDDSFVNAGVNWNSASLNDAEISQLPSSTVTLTLDNDAKPADIPFDGMGTLHQIKVSAAGLGDIEDDPGNAPSSTYAIEVIDATPVWVQTCEITDIGNFLRITCKFGKQVSVDADILDKDENLIAIDGDPNMPKAISNLTASTTFTIDVSEDRNTDWQPVVSFDLDSDTIIKDKNNDDGINDLTEDFSVTADDKIPARIANATPGTPYATIPAFNTLTVQNSNGDMEYYIEVPIIFTENLSPDNYATPTRAYRYFDSSPDYSIEEFVTTGTNSCSGKKLTVKLKSDVSITDGCIVISFDDNPPVVDLNGNESTLGAPWYKLTPGVPVGQWVAPPDVIADINITPTYMKIRGKVIDPNGNAFEGDGDSTNPDAVYAFSRDNLFVKEYDPSDDDIVTKVSFDVSGDSHKRCYGAGTIDAEGNYSLTVYGYDEDPSSGFKPGEPVILVVYDHVDGTVANDKNLICTTACLANTQYSIPFVGQKYPVLKEMNLYLNQREEIKLQPGWNFISTSIDTGYVDSEACLKSGVDASFYQGYMYKPGDPLTAPGSLPSNVYNMESKNHRDSSSLFFTIADDDLENRVYNPYAFYNTDDYLNDSLNVLSGFGPGLALYVKIDTEIADPDSDWHVVLFGNKVDGPENKVRVDSGQAALVGHWGNFMYHNDQGQTASDTLNMNGELPSTYVQDNNFYVDDIAQGEGTNPAATKFAISVTDVNDAPVMPNTVSTFFNNEALTGPAVWWGDPDLIDLSDLTVVTPGGGAWIQIDNGSGGPYFINYMSAPED